MLRHFSSSHPSQTKWSEAALTAASTERMWTPPTRCTLKYAVHGKVLYGILCSDARVRSSTRLKSRRRGSSCATYLVAAVAIEWKKCAANLVAMPTAAIHRTRASHFCLRAVHDCTAAPGPTMKPKMRADGTTDTSAKDGAASCNPYRVRARVAVKDASPTTGMMFVFRE